MKFRKILKLIHNFLGKKNLVQIFICDIRDKIHCQTEINVQGGLLKK